MAGKRGKALFDCVGESDEEISFSVGTILTDIQPSNEIGWLVGTVEGSNPLIRGLFPQNYVQFIEQPPSLLKSSQEIPSIPSRSSSQMAPVGLPPRPSNFGAPSFNAAPEVALPPRPQSVIINIPTIPPRTSANTNNLNSPSQTPFALPPRPTNYNDSVLNAVNAPVPLPRGPSAPKMNANISVAPTANVSVVPNASVAVTPAANVSVAPNGNVSVNPSANLSIFPDTHLPVTPAANVSVNRGGVSINPSLKLGIAPGINASVPISPRPQSTARPNLNVNIAPASVIPNVNTSANVSVALLPPPRSNTSLGATLPARPGSMVTTVNQPLGSVNPAPFALPPRPTNNEDPKITTTTSTSTTANTPQLPRRPQSVAISAPPNNNSNFPSIPPRGGGFQNPDATAGLSSNPLPPRPNSMSIQLPPRPDSMLVQLPPRPSTDSTTSTTVNTPQLPRRPQSIAISAPPNNNSNFPSIPPRGGGFQNPDSTPTPTNPSLPPRGQQQNAIPTPALPSRANNSQNASVPANTPQLPRRPQSMAISTPPNANNSSIPNEDPPRYEEIHQHTPIAVSSVPAPVPRSNASSSSSSSSPVVTPIPRTITNDPPPSSSNGKKKSSKDQAKEVKEGKGEGKEGKDGKEKEKESGIKGKFFSKFSSGSSSPKKPTPNNSNRSANPANPPEPTDGWLIPAHDRNNHSFLFASKDLDNDGFLTGMECKTLFLQMGLEKMVLAAIWALSDIDQDGKLDKNEFILAMYLIDQTKIGVPPPLTLPIELVPPNKKKFITYRRNNH